MPAPKPSPVSAEEAKALFSELAGVPALMLAVSGGPDSTALMWLAARWRKSLKTKKAPKLIAATVDHGLRAESAREAVAVKRLAKRLGIAHHTLVWRDRKPSAGLQQAARRARYGLLAQLARKAGATHILTGHTLDDQAETVLMRMSRGSGLSGLAAMAPASGLPVAQPAGGTPIKLVRPLLDIPKSRLIDTLRSAKIDFATDLSNHDPRFTRVRWRTVMPQLAQEGLDARRLALLAQRFRRADAAIEAYVERAMTTLAANGPEAGAVVFPAQKFARLPAEFALRLLGRAVKQVGTEGPVELAKLEALQSDIKVQIPAGPMLRRTLAGAMVTVAGGNIRIETAPPRRKAAVRQALPRRRKALTTRPAGTEKRRQKR